MTDATNVQGGFAPGAAKQLDLDEYIITVVMARVTDHFGFFVYAFASVLVFPAVFFPSHEPATAVMLSFAVFPLAFLARPFASQAFKRLERRIGRSGKITLALFILGGSTMAIGLLPSYETAGVLAPLLLILMRIGQGIGLGGSWDGLTLLLQTNAPENRRGWYAMIPQLGAPIGLCVAAAIFYVLTGFLTEEEFVSWGWRWPFFAVLAVNVVSLFARLQLIHSAAHEMFKEEALLKSSPFFEMLSVHWKDVLLATFLPLASYAILHMVTVFPLAVDYLEVQRPISDLLLLLLLGSVVSIPSVVVSGVLSDRFGRRRMLAIVSVAIALFSFIVTNLLDGGALYVLVGYVLLGLSYGQASAILPNRFQKQYRYTASALSVNLSWIFGAAFAPLVALSLSLNFGLAFAGGYLLSGALVTLAALAVLSSREKRAARTVAASPDNGNF
ncbi:MFS transporter [Roseibium aggregatum]|uniref:MFS transporter n=1 Tax=Roseibium aggregatum TaxID=187304 RepID=A0A939J3A7_9HYPH|nr:MFS transporter [Roseibium aggregatum]MBN9674036.1 MFS transporter [Roseibium aggregatum]